MRQMKVNEGVLLKDEPTLSGRKGLTVEFLREALSVFPKDAEVVLENYNAGDLRILAEVVAQNFDRSGTIPGKYNKAARYHRQSRSAIAKKKGPVNTVVLGYWDEGREDVDHEK